MPQDEIIGDSLPAHLTEEFFAVALETGLRVGAVQVLDMQLERTCSGGENYCSNIYQLLVKHCFPNAAPSASTGGSEQEGGDAATSTAMQQLVLIVKCMPWHKQGVLRRLAIYDKELHFYMDIMPQMETLMWQTTNRPWQLGGQLIYASTRPEQTLVFRDLCASGFQLRSRQHGLDAAHAAAVLRKLGEYHALSLRMAERDDGATFTTRYPYGILNEASICAPPFEALFGAQLLKLIALLTKCDDDAELQSIAQKLMRYYEEFKERVLNAVWQPRRGKWNVLCHGDLWVNNIFFRYTNEDGKSEPAEVRFIDFQLCFYGSIGFDLNYFFNTSVQLEVLQTQRCTLLGTYYDALQQTLQKLQYTKSPLPTFDDILREVREREAYGLFVAFAFFPLMTMVRVDSQDNSLTNFQDPDFARRKIALMFESNPRTLATLKYTMKRWNDLGILN